MVQDSRLDLRRLTSLLLILLVLTGSCGPTEPVTRPGSSSVPTTSTTPQPESTVQATSTTPPVIADAVVFADVDTGVASQIRQLTLDEAEQLEIRQPLESTDGAAFSLSACVTTWPNSWEIHGEWSPAPDAPSGPSQWVFLVGLSFGDVIGGDSIAQVTLEGPGAFVVPLTFDPRSPQWQRADATYHEYRGDRPFDGGPPCQLVIVSGSQPVVSRTTPFVDATTFFVAPVSDHAAGSLQAELEAMVDPVEHWLGALAWHVGLYQRPPVDVLYLRPGVKVDWMQITQQSTCVGMAIVYADEVTTGQASGCPPGAEPLDGFAADELTEMQDGWRIGAEGADAVDLVPVPWEGAPRAATGFDPDRYIEELVLPEGHRIVATLEFGDGVILLIEQQGEPTLFYSEELFTGGGGGYVGGGPGESWKGCWRVDYSDAGYAIILVEDESWSVTYQGSVVDLIPAGDVAAGLITGTFDRPPTFDVQPEPNSGCS